MGFYLLGRSLGCYETLETWMIRDFLVTEKVKILDLEIFVNSEILTAHFLKKLTCMRISAK